MQRVGDIKRVMDRRVFDTEAAEAIHTFEPLADQGDFHYYIETLYVTDGGSYFVAGEGGAMSPYSESLGGGPDPVRVQEEPVGVPIEVGRRVD